MMADMLDFNDAPTQDGKPISIALAYAARGWPVFPCNPLTKAPLTGRDVDEQGREIPSSGGLKKATTDPFQIRKWWGATPNAMIGIPTGEKTGFWVFDIDNGDGKTGLQSLAEMGHDLSELMDTVAANTASGGYHCLFRFDPAQPIGNARGALRKHLDVRGEGGYIIAAGSVRADGQRYAWLNPPDENEIADAPEWLLTTITAGNFPKISESSNLDFNDAQRRDGREFDDLVKGIVSGDTYHENLVSLSARLVGSNMHPGAAVSVLRGLMEAVPPERRDERWRDRYNDISRTVATAEMKFGVERRPEPVTPAEQAHEALRFKILTIAELVNVKPPEWRIDGIFPTHGSSVLYGAYETFKTFIALDMTLCLATGRDWMGRATKPCSVLYIAGEGQVGLGIRAAGWLAAKGIDQAEARFQALPEAVALPNIGDQDALLRAIDGMDDHPDVIVFDTVTRMTGGGSLNDEKDAQGYVRGLDRVRSATGAHMFNIGHSGKDKERGILGSTVLPAAMETIICVERRDRALTLINANPKGKQKDGPNFDDIKLQTEIVDFEHQGQPLKTVILVADESASDDENERHSRPQSAASPRAQGANQVAVMSALKKAKGEALGLTRLSAMAGRDGSKVAQAVAPLVAKGLVIETGEEGAKRWTLA